MLAGFVIPWGGLGASAVHLVSCRHILEHACLICPGAGDCVSLACQRSYHQPGVASRAFPSSDSLGGGYVPGVCLSPSSSHHLVRRGCFVLIVLGCRLGLPRCSLFSSWAVIVRRTAGVVSHQPLRLVLIELGKTAQNMISRSSSSDVPGLLVSLLVLPSRRGVSCRIVVVVFARGDGRVLRFCSLASRRGSGASFVHPAAWRCACPHPSPVVSFASRPSVSCGVSLLIPHVLLARAARRACSYHRGLIVLVERGWSWCWGILSCLSRLI